MCILDKFTAGLLILFTDVGDKQIEVVGLENSMHAAQVYAGLRASGKRLAQCSSVVIRYILNTVKPLLNTSKLY